MSSTDRSRARGVYLVIALVGLALVVGPLMAWLVAHGLDLRLALAELTATGMTTAAFLDLIGAAVAVLALVWFDRREGRVPHVWLPVLVTCTISVGFGLAFYLFLREGARALPAS
jgi:hypothetical protein